jgi:hypothetical protein
VGRDLTVISVNSAMKISADRGVVFQENRPSRRLLSGYSCRGSGGRRAEPPIRKRTDRGTEAQFVREIDSECVLVFHPDGRVEGSVTSASAEFDQVIRDVILKYAPEAAQTLGGAPGG